MKRLITACILIALVTTTMIYSSNPVKIGMYYPSSGEYRALGLDQLRAARMAVDEINTQGGILGQKVELVCQEVGSDSYQALSDVEHLLAQQKLHLLTGGTSGNVDGAVSDICQRAEVIHMSPVDRADKTTGTRAHRYTFRSPSSTWMSSRSFSQYLQSEWPDASYFYLTSDNYSGWQTEHLIRQFTATQDEYVYKRFLLSSDCSTDQLTRTVQTIATQQPRVLVVVQEGQALARTLQLAHKYGLHRTSQIVVPYLDPAQAVAFGPKITDGIIAGTDWAAQVPYVYPSQQGQKFVQEFQARYEKRPSSAAANVYTGIMQYRAAAERAGSLSSVEVIKELEGHDFAALKDGQTWRNFDHQCLQSYYLVKFHGSSWAAAKGQPKDYYEVVARIPADQLARTYEQWSHIRELAGMGANLEPLSTMAGN